MTGEKDVDRYLRKVPPEARSALERLRETVKAAAPDATEAISYQMPTFKYKGRGLVGYAAFKDHCSLFPYSNSVFDTFAKELAPRRASKGTIHFTPEKPLSVSLIKKLVKARMKEIEAKEKARGR